jgi:hypothetical protein
MRANIRSNHGLGGSKKAVGDNDLNIVSLLTFDVWVLCQCLVRQKPIRFGLIAVHEDGPKTHIIRPSQDTASSVQTITKWALDQTCPPIWILIWRTAQILSWLSRPGIYSWDTCKQVPRAFEFRPDSEVLPTGQQIQEGLPGYERVAAQSTSEQES